MSKTSTPKSNTVEIRAQGYPDLRDYFAMAALTGILAADKDGTYEDFAHDAYGYADAMMEARTGRK